MLRYRRFRRASLLFAGIFLFAVATQLGVGWYRRREDARAFLRQSVDEIRGELRYGSRWDLTRQRQADIGGQYYVLDVSDLTIEFEGFPADLTFRADVTDLQPGTRSVILPLTNESWRLLVAPVRGGWVLVGVSPPEDITKVDERLQQNAKLFGESLEQATRITPSDIDRNLYYGVLDDRGVVQFAIGGIPLTLIEYPRTPNNRVEEINGRSGQSYALLSVPFASASGKVVGTVTALQGLTPEPWFSFSAWLVNLSSSLVLALLGTLIGVRYVLLAEALEKGESQTVEFKESLRWDHWKSADEPDGQRKPAERTGLAEAIAVKTIAGFLNTRLGGTLVIGIADDKTVVGLDLDYDSLAKPGDDRLGLEKQRDRFQLHLRNLLASKIGRDLSNLCVTTAILSRDGKDVCIGNVSPSPTPVYITGPKGKSSYLRVGAATDELDVEEAVAYCRERWPAALLRRSTRLTRLS